MNKPLQFLTAFFFALTLSLNAQSPEKLSYQAIVRNSSNVILANQSVGVQISILKGTASRIPVYIETQNPTSNANGLINLEIGTGNVLIGSFNTIDWSNDTYFIKTEIDTNGGNNYTITGTSQLMSVPYALHAKTAESISGGINETDPSFTASAAKGITSTDITNWNNKLAVEVDGSVTNEIELPEGGNDGQVLKTDGEGNYAWVDQTVDTDTDTQLNETQVDAFVANNGYLTEEVDGSVTNEIELPEGGNDGQVLKTDGSGNYAWVDQTTDTDTQLNETQVDAFVANNGYLTEEVDGSVTNEIELPEGGNDGQVLKTDGEGNYTWVDQTTDTDTQLNETQVDAFVANNGYLTEEVDGSVTNEIELPEGGNDGQVLKTDGNGNYAWIDLPESNTPNITTISANTTLTTGGIVFINGPYTAKLPANPTDGMEVKLFAIDGMAIIDGNGKSLYFNQRDRPSIDFYYEHSNFYTFVYSSTFDAWVGGGAAGW